MFYSYVKQTKVGELAEGENPMHTIRIGAEDLAVLEERREMYLSKGWELAEESEWEGADESVVEAVVATEESAEEVAEAVEEVKEEEVPAAEEPAKEAE